MKPAAIAPFLANNEAALAAPPSQCAELADATEAAGPTAGVPGLPIMTAGPTAKTAGPTAGAPGRTARAAGLTTGAPGRAASAAGLQRRAAGSTSGNAAAGISAGPIRRAAAIGAVLPAIVWGALAGDAAVAQCSSGVVSASIYRAGGVGSLYQGVVCHQTSSVPASFNAPSAGTNACCQHTVITPTSRIDRWLFNSQGCVGPTNLMSVSVWLQNAESSCSRGWAIPLARNCNGAGFRTFRSLPAACMCVRGLLPETMSIEFAAPPGYVVRWARANASSFLTDGPSATGSVYSGTQTPVLRISDVELADAGEYIMYAAPGAVPVLSTFNAKEHCVVFVDETIPEILSMPHGREACVGGTTTFHVGTGGTGHSYTWWLEGFEASDGPTAYGVVSGASTDTLTISGLTASAEPRVLSCVVSNQGRTNHTYEALLYVSSNQVAPTVEEHPANWCARGAAATFSVRAVDVGAGSVLAYQWRKNGQPLMDNGRIRGSNWPTLEIEHPTPADNGAYDCVVSRGCASTTSSAAALAICPADIDDDGDFSNGHACDGGVDINDLLFFLAAFEAGDVSGGDLDDGNGQGVPDGGVDINDLLFFLAHFEAGC